MFRVNNKNTRKTLVTGGFTVNFEQINVSLDRDTMISMN